MMLSDEKTEAYARVLLDFFLQVFKVFPHPLAYPSRHFKIPVYASGERPYLVDQTSEHFVEPSYDHYQSLM